MAADSPGVAVGKSFALTTTEAIPTGHRASHRFRIHGSIAISSGRSELLARTRPSKVSIIEDFRFGPPDAHNVLFPDFLYELSAATF